MSGRALRLGAYASTWLIWGSTYLAIKWAVETLPPFLTVALRSLAAGAILLAWAALRGDVRPSRAQWRAAALAGAMYFLVGHGLLFWAEQHVASGPAALMIATEHFWVVLIAWMLPGGQAPSRRAAAGIAIGLVGVGMLTLGGGGEGGVEPLGAIVLLLSAAGWASGSLYFSGERRPASPLYASAMPLVMGGALLMGVSAAAGETARVRAADFTPLAIASLLYLVVFGSVIAFTAFTWLVDADSPSRAGSYAYVNPFVAVVLGWAVAGEALTPRMLAAGAAIVLAVVLIVRGTRMRAPSQPPAPAAPRRVHHLTERKA